MAPPSGAAYLEYQVQVSCWSSCSAIIILSPASPPGAHDGKVMDRQGSRQMALSGRTDDERVNEAFALLAGSKGLILELWVGMRASLGH